MIEIVDRVTVYADPERDLHGPCVIRAGNGDLLLSHQDSVQHRGNDGFTHQWRSTDNGFTWEDEGPVADWRTRGFDSLFGDYGLASDGGLVMVVQRREILTDNKGIVGSWIQKSDDHGHSWQEVGAMDDSDTHAVMFARSPTLHEGVFYAGVWSRHGNALYVSDERGLEWTKRNTIFPNDDERFPLLKEAGPPFYPHVVVCPDGSMLAMAYSTPPVHHCFSRRSTDLAETWEPIVEETELKLWAPRMRPFDSDTLIVTGRDIEAHETVAYFSSDSGRTWGGKMTIDKPAFRGSYAYSDSVDAGDGRFWVFTSSPQSEGKGDIVGILLGKA